MTRRSRAVSRTKNAELWVCTPSRGSRAVLRGQGLSPRTATVPESARRWPSMISTSVVLPAPLGPSRPKNSPRATVSDTPSTARVAPYVLWTPVRATAGPAAGSAGGSCGVRGAVDVMELSLGWNTGLRGPEGDQAVSR
ncbi:putative protein OS=Streptomyces microflavus OX=1919 GN=Smic_30440 PE=4 SV=1 [Streptomyces microflavus]